MVLYVGVDLDTKSIDAFYDVLRFADNHPDVYSVKSIVESAQGYHFWFLLKEEVDYLESFDLRYYLGDDVGRIMKDLRRYRLGLRRGIDTLFDYRLKYCGAQR